MTDGIVAQETKFEIESGSGVAKTITGVTLGAVTEITSVAHGLAVGDVVTFAGIVGTTELNGQSAMVIAVETDSFFVLIDSSAYSAYTSDGTATPATYTEISEVTDWDGPGTGEAAEIDFTHLRSTRKEFKIGLADEGSLSLTLNFVPDDAGQQALLASRNAQTEKGYRITYSDGTIDTFDGYCKSFGSSGAVDGKDVATANVRINGAVTRV